MTTARPPRCSPSSPSDIKKDHPERKLCTVPFSKEMETLARMFEPLLPFSLISSTVPNRNDIHKYTFQMPKYGSFDGATSANLTFVMWDNRFISVRGGEPGEIGREDISNNLRDILDASSSELDPYLNGTKIDSFREKGVSIWSTFRWDLEKTLVSAWIPRSFVEMASREAWVCNLYRVDGWVDIYTASTPVKSAVKKAESWASGLSF